MAEAAMNEGLLRQRRNLMVTCCLLFLLSASGASVEKVGLAGFEMKFERAAALFFSLWLAFAYYFYRYYVYFRAVGQGAFAARFSQPFLREINELARFDVVSAHGEPTSIRNSLRWSTAWAWPLSIEIRKSGEYVDGVVPTSDENHVVKISRGARAALLIREWRKTLLTDTAITDYAFPFAFAIFVFVYAGVSDWQGGFSRIVDGW